MMEYREIGNTGIRVAPVGLGTEHLDLKPYDVVERTIHAALDAGVNMMDVFMPGDEVRANIGKALSGRRDDVVLQGHIGSTDIGQQYDISRDLETNKRYFEALLKQLGTDYIDFGMLFFLDSQKDFDAIFENGIVDYAQQLKKQGTVRALGASSHNPAIAKQIVESGVIDLLMFSINPAFDLSPDTLDGLMEGAVGDNYLTGVQPARAELYRLCESKNVGISVMKTLGAGRLLDKEQSPFAEPFTVPQLINYALSRPGVVSALVGCQSPEQVAEAASYYSLSAEALDYTKPLLSFKDSFEGNCVYCNHCQPCPVEIDIAAVNRCLDTARVVDGEPAPSAAAHYAALGAHGGDCISCGSCEDRCPFSVPVIENMRAASELFGE